nr:MAG TPA: HK97 Family Phage Portal Protein [Caudoviricetes sp.]
MNIKSVKAPQPRVDIAYLSQLNIQSYGKDNLYPQNMALLLENSPTGGGCRDRYASFIEGNGFADIILSNYILNRKGNTANDIEHLIAKDIADFNGFAIHVNYNLFCEIVEISHVPFSNCRLEEEDDNGYVAHIVVHPDWSGKKTRKGQPLKVDKSKVDYIDVFNPNKNVVLAQIEASGGIEFYKGQVLWVSLDGFNIYPKPIYDKIVTELSTDEGLSNVKYRNTRYNFMPFGAYIHKKAQASPLDDGEYDNANDSGFAESLTKFQGDTNTGNMIEIELQSDEDLPLFQKWEGNNYDSKFIVTEASTIDRIYAAFCQDPWYTIRIGKTGFSGNILQEVYEYYNSIVRTQRSVIERTFKKVFLYWHEKITDNYAIEPLKYISNESSDNSR